MEYRASMAASLIVHQLLSLLQKIVNMLSFKGILQ
jgi:hypothetical protein